MNDHHVTSAVNKLRGVYRDVSRVVSDCSSLIRSQIGQNLRPSASTFIQNDGTTCHALLLSGTIPMVYKGTQYNIPIDMYITPKYPTLPPVVYVRPISSMVIKEGHHHVASDGMVYMPYFNQWNHHCNLNDACKHMSQVFSIEPPVFSKPPGWRPSNSVSSKPPVSHEPMPPPPPRYEDILVSTSTNGMRSSSFEKDQLERLAREADEANAVAAVARAAEAKEAQERNLASKARDRLLQRAYDLLRIHNTTLDSSIVNLLIDQVMLDKSKSHIKAQEQYLKVRKRDLEDCHKEVDDVSDIISSQIKAIENESSIKDEIRLDDLALPKDIHSAQMLVLSAENAAIKDAVFFIDKAFADRKLNLDTHLRSVRKLAKRQFLLKAHLLKIGQVKAADIFRQKRIG